MGTHAEVRRKRVGRLLDQVVFPAVQPLVAPLRLSISRLPGEPVPPSAAAGLSFRPFTLGETWGGAWSTAWLKAEGEIPDHFDGRHVVARIDLGYRAQPGFGGEALVFDGTRPLQGVNPKHNTVELSGAATAGDPVRLLVEAAANPGQREGPLEWPLLMPDYEGAPLYRLRRFDLAVVDDEMTDVLYDWSVLTELVDVLGLGHARSAEILEVLDRVARTVELDDLSGSLVARRHEWAPLLDRPGAPRSHEVTAVGHAHIDSAWLWPIRETKRKCARTFSTAIRMMETRPDYVFVCSQAQQHAWMEELYPELFEEMTRFAAAGQFEPVGSMWVEPDTNLPSGESLCRQLVFGKRFFSSRYGIETLDCWLPDAFGFSGSLPGILQAAGVRRFFTQKLSWNETNAFPHHTFWWEGIDGSRVLAHCPPTNTYNGEFTVAELEAGEANFAHHDVSDRSLYVYGYGDGGGGPTEEMLERARRMADLDPLPRVGLGRSADFFGALEHDAAAREARAAAKAAGTVATAHAPGPGDLPIWVGELYLERHRAVQTTQARSKLGNRRCEGLLREAELWSVAGLEGEEVRRAATAIDSAWETVLLHQFHDILPGSGIHWVHADSRAAYDGVATTLGEVVAHATGQIAAAAASGGRGGGSAPTGEGGSKDSLGAIVVFNAATRDRTGVVEVDLGDCGLEETPTVAIGPNGATAPVQALGARRVLVPVEVSGSGWAGYDLCSVPPGNDGPTPAHPARVEGGHVLTNGLVSVSLDEAGLVSSIRDLVEDRELVEAGERANLFQLHHDLPNNFDAWDVDPGTFERAVACTELASLEVRASGPVRASVIVTRPIGRASQLVQEIRVEAGSRRIEFVTEVEWRERHRFLKVAFPVTVRSPHATYEIQFGHLERPTHANTSWDAAKFEVPAQRWADLSEPGFGVALLNDAKYGYDVRRNVMRLSCLRGPGWPDPEADAGRHRFSYALLPHAGGRGLEDVIAEAEAFNLPLRAVPSAAGAATGQLLSVSGASLSAVKWADDGSGDVVVRLYEHLGGRSRAVLGGLGARRAVRADLLERPGADVAVDTGEIRLELAPFELVTLRVSR